MWLGFAPATGTQAFARLAARLHPQPTQPAPDEAPTLDARAGAAPSPADTEQASAAAAKQDVRTTGSQSNEMKARA